MKTKHVVYVVFCLFFLCCKHNDNTAESDFSLTSDLLSSYQSIDDSVFNIRRHWVVERTSVNKVRIEETVEDLNQGGESYKRIYQDVSIKKEGDVYSLEFEHCKIDTKDHEVILGYAALDSAEPNHLFAHVIIQNVKTKSLVPHCEYGIAMKKI
ncbi:MAG: hypothetical protein J7619_31550 [Dyadobacter sp.]|uniref:hypothetical protein n=1 Tax=Dyadobacter sp. TaxID=1914288 RepID=UPI001B0FF328|nr:hypothetical protein [Dyadobacter sp.]MBO9617262.1 hypothetical protein [Dyadobacter sp.]